MMEDGSKRKKLKISDLEGISLTVIPFTVAVGAHRHVVRGKTKGRDLLFKSIMKRVSRFYLNIRIKIEDGKIGGLTKARIKLCHLRNDLKER